MQSGSAPDPTQEKLNLSSFSAVRLAPGFFCKFLLHCLKNVQKLRSPSEKSLPFGFQAFAVCLGVDSWPSSFLRSVFVQNNVAAVEDDITLTENDITAIKNDITLTESDITAIENDITLAESDITTIEDDITTIEDDVYLDEDDIYFNDDDSFHYLL